MIFASTFFQDPLFSVKIFEDPLNSRKKIEDPPQIFGGWGSLKNERSLMGHSNSAQYHLV